MSHREIEEIDAIELLLVLWRNKAIIFTLFVTGFLVGAAVYFLTPQKHQSIITMQFGELPYGVTETATIRDFSNLFFDPEVHGAWRSEADNFGFDFQDIAPSHSVDQFTVFKPISARLAFIDDKLHLVVINSNHLPTIQSIFEYSNFASGRLASVYANDVRTKLEFAKTMAIKEPMQLQGSLSSILSLQGYLYKASSGAQPIMLSHPTKPKMISKITGFFWLLGAGLGILFGVIFVLMRHAIQRRLEKA